MLTAMWSFFLLALFGLGSSSAKCPARYERFSLEHTFCIPRNPRCDIKRIGVSQQDIQEILSLHNQYRSELAIGKETRAKGGTLPKAADMLQMVWDDELAAIAQKWADNCKFKHDCNECRAVTNFAVGQNLAIQRGTCSYCKEEDMIKPKWADAVQKLYNEVLDFHKSWLDRFESHEGPVVGHFTQIIWSKTWRLGCGYTAYKTGEKYNRFYVCNYGPAGNIIGQPIYKKGQPCSACPANSCCGSSCKSGPNYPGLCKMLNPNRAPIYERDLDSLLFFCDSNPKREDCRVKVGGAKIWTIIPSLQGNYMSVALNGGESTKLVFKKQIEPTQTEFCIRFKFRKGPLNAEENDESSLTALYKVGRRVKPMNLALSENEFTSYSVDLGWKMKTALALAFSVPEGATPHILDVMEVIAFDGNCKSRQD